jgi:subtilisin family serine protease
MYAISATPPIRKAPHRSRPAVETLEDRLVPSTATDHILVQYRNDSAVHKVVLDKGVTVEQALADYKSRANVAVAEADQVVSVAATIPNDPLFPHDYGLNNTGQPIPGDPYVGTPGTPDADIDAPEAWDITRGSMTTTVAIIDTGIQYTHNDLYLNIWINQGEIPPDIRARLTDVDGDGVITFRDLNNSVNQGPGKITDLNGNGYIDGGDLIKPRAQGGWADGINQDASSEPAGTSYTDDLIGWDFLNHDNDPWDDNVDSHGTHVAGTIGAIANNGRGVAGVNWFVQMAALKFLPASGGGLTSDAAAALDYAVAKGIPISNNSWGGTGFNDTMYASLVNAESAGHIFVAAAGNGGSDNLGDDNDGTNPVFPASYDLGNIIAVAATDHTDALTSFSNYGATSVDLAAPGWYISSTYNNNTYAYMSGTSMASPHVTGVVALVESVKQGMTYTQVIHQVLDNVDVKSNLAGLMVTGGRLNAYKAVSSPGPNTSAPMVVSLTPNVAADNSVSSVRVTFSEAIVASTFTAADVSGFTGPKGSIKVKGIQAVTGSGGTAFDITFAKQTALGTYRLTLGPDIRDSAGNPMNQDGDFALGEATQDQYQGQFVLTAPGGSGTGSSQSLAGNGPAAVVKNGPSPGASPSRDAAAANVGAGPGEIMKSGPARGTSPSRDAVVANVGAIDAALLLLGKPAREQVPPSSRVADPLRFAPPVSFDSIPVQGKVLRQIPAGAGGRSEPAQAVDSLFECFEQIGWQGDEDQREDF